jgi:hypothetical protein
MTDRIRTTTGTMFPIKVGRLSAVERIITGRVTVRIDSKGYPVFKSGVYRDVRVHVAVAQALEYDRKHTWEDAFDESVSLKLRKDLDVHHRNARKLDFEPSNLHVIGHAVHGWLEAWKHTYVDHLIAEREAHAWGEWHSTYGGGSLKRLHFKQQVKRAASRRPCSGSLSFSQRRGTR